MNKKKARLIENEEVGYSHKYDAYYDRKTGRWLERVCGCPYCEFCGKRPKKHPITKPL